jgi:hypothetical protein
MDPASRKFYVVWLVPPLNHCTGLQSVQYCLLLECLMLQKTALNMVPAFWNPHPVWAVRLCREPWQWFHTLSHSVHSYDTQNYKGLLAWNTIAAFRSPDTVCPVRLYKVSKQWIITVSSTIYSWLNIIRDWPENNSSF